MGDGERAHGVDPPRTPWVVALPARALPDARNSSSVKPGNIICAPAAWPFRGHFASEHALSGRSAVSTRSALPESLSAVEPPIRPVSLIVKRPRSPPSRGCREQDRATSARHRLGHPRVGRGGADRSDATRSAFSMSSRAPAKSPRVAASMASRTHASRNEGRGLGSPDGSDASGPSTGHVTLGAGSPRDA